MSRRQCHTQVPLRNINADMAGPPRDSRMEPTSIKRSNKFSFNINDQEPENQIARQKNLDNATTDTLINQTTIQTETKTVGTHYLTATTSLPLQQTTKTLVSQRNEAMNDYEVLTYMHKDEIAYIENTVFPCFLKHHENTLLTELMSQQRFSGNDRFVRQQVLMYLFVSSILKGDRTYDVSKDYNTIEKRKLNSEILEDDKFSCLKKWAVFTLRKNSDLSTCLEEKRFTKEWFMLAQDKIEELASLLADKKNYEEAILISAIHDRTFRESFEFNNSNYFRKQFSYIQAQSIKVTPKSFWLIDFAIAIQYFQSGAIFDYLLDICKKYQTIPKNVKVALLPSLIALTLYFSKDEHSLQLEKTIEKIITLKKRLSYVDQILYLSILKQHKSKYPKLFSLIVQSLINRVKNPGLLPSLFKFSEFNQNQVALSIKLIYENPNFRSKRSESTQKLFQSIIEENNEKITSKSSLSFNALCSWMHCQRFRELFMAQSYLESANYFLEHYCEIKASITHDPKEIYQLLVKNIVKFEIACSYKESQRKTYYNLLENIKDLAEKDYNTDIVKGCLAFIELKFKVFWLRDKEKLSQLYTLFLYLQSLLTDKTTSENARCFLVNIKNNLESLLLTLDGQIYLRELANEISSPSKREQYARIVKRPLKERNSIESQDFPQSQYFKLLEILNWNQKIANYIATKLLFP